MLEVHIFEYRCGTFVVDVTYSYWTESDYFASLCSGRVSLPMGEGLNVIGNVVDCFGHAAGWAQHCLGCWAGWPYSLFVRFFALSLRVAEIGLH